MEGPLVRYFYSFEPSPTWKFNFVRNLSPVITELCSQAWFFFFSFSLQGFSGMNRFNQSAWSKVQCEMILAFLSFADFFRPKYFLLENVRNFVSFNKGQTFRLALASLLEMGYQVKVLAIKFYIEPLASAFLVGSINKKDNRMKFQSTHTH